MRVLCCHVVVVAGWLSSSFLLLLFCFFRFCLLRLCLCWCATPICFVFSPAIVFSLLLRTKKPRVPDEPTALQTTRQKKKGFIFFSCLVFFLFFYFSIFLFFRVKIESKNRNKEFPTVWWHQPAGSGDFSVFDCQPFPCNRCPNGASINN